MKISQYADIWWQIFGSGYFAIGVDRCQWYMFSMNRNRVQMYEHVGQNNPYLSKSCVFDPDI